TALEAASRNLTEHLKRNPQLDIADVAYTAAVGRRPLDHRRMLVAASIDDAISGLESLDPTRVLTAAVDKEHPVVFMFPGQGTQYVDMGKGLYQTEPVFSHYVDLCSRLLLEEIGLDLRRLLYPESIRTETSSQLDTTEITQPVLFAVEYAMAKMLMEW